jgi:hypothetical protein
MDTRTVRRIPGRLWRSFKQNPTISAFSLLFTAAIVALGHIEEIRTAGDIMTAHFGPHPIVSFLASPWFAVFCFIVVLVCLFYIGWHAVKADDARVETERRMREEVALRVEQAFERVLAKIAITQDVSAHIVYRAEHEQLRRNKEHFDQNINALRAHVNGVPDRASNMEFAESLRTHYTMVRRSFDFLNESLCDNERLVEGCPVPPDFYFGDNGYSPYDPKLFASELSQCRSDIAELLKLSDQMSAIVGTRSIEHAAILRRIKDYADEQRSE